jgi:hypothetical protein
MLFFFSKVLVFMNNKLIFSLFFLFSLLFSAESMVGIIHSVSGDVTIYSSTQTNSVKKAIIGRAIYDGDRIATSNNGICQILYKDENIFIRVSENSKIKFSSAGYSDIIDLMSGQLYCQKAQNNRTIKVFTSIGQYSCDNGRFWLSTHLNKNDEVLIHSGNVHLNNQYSLSDIILKKGEAGISFTNGEVFVGEYNNLDLIDLKPQTKIIEDFIQPIILEKNIPQIYSSDLIPQYKTRISIFNDNVQSFKNYRYQFGTQSNGESYIQVISYFHKFDFKVGVAIPFVFGNDGFRKSDWDDIFDLFDRINYLDYFNNENKYEIHLGKIENKTWGAGGLLHNYTNTQNYPNTVRTGLDGSISMGNKFLNFNYFISSLRDFKNGGGLMGLRSEMYLTDHFPLTIGFGFITDLNNYSEINSELQFLTRTISGSEVDFSYELFSSVNNYFNLFLEYDELYYNEEIIFTSPSKDIIKKPGGSNWLFGFEHKKGSLISTISFSLASKTMKSEYFNSVYDLEKARYISISEDLIINSDSRLNDLNNFRLNHTTNLVDSTFQDYLIPKNIYSVYNDRLNFYDTPGIKISMQKYFGTYGHFNFSYGFKMEKLDAQYDKIYNSLSEDDKLEFEYVPKKYHSLKINTGIGDKVIRGIHGFNFFYNQYNAPTFFSFNDELTSAEMGFNISIRPIQFMRLIIENKMIHYDFNSDGVIDKANNLNVEFKFSI